MLEITIWVDLQPNLSIYCNQQRAKGPLSTPYPHPPQGESVIVSIFQFFVFFIKHKQASIKLTQAPQNIN